MVGPWGGIRYPWRWEAGAEDRKDGREKRKILRFVFSSLLFTRPLAGLQFVNLNLSVGKKSTCINCFLSDKST